MSGLGIGQLADVLGNLETQTLRVHPAQCSRLRHRLSTCTLCADHCPGQAIIWEDRSLRTIPEKCTGCGACAAVCPTGAFEVQAPNSLEMLRRIREMAREGEVLALICPTYLGTGRTVAGRCIEVNCLGRLDESVLVAAAAKGIPRLYLVDGACRDCRNSAAHAVTERVVQRSNALLQAFGLPRRISLAPDPPAGTRASRRPPERASAVSRRDFFTLLAGRTRLAALSTLESALGVQSHQPLTSIKGGELPRRLSLKHQLLLASLKQLQPPSDALLFRISGGPWAQFDFDGNCTGCQMCATFCPTGALGKLDQQGAVGVTFRISHCTNCGLCRDICFRRAVNLSNEIDLGKVWEDAIVSMPMPAPEKRLPTMP